MDIIQTTQNPVIDLVLDTLAKKKQALIFVGSKRSAQKTACDIALELKKQHKTQYLKISESLLSVLNQPTDQCKKLAQSSLYGIAFHHAGLATKQREIIEEQFRNTQLPIIVCTPTLAAGMDLPAFRTILKDVKRFNPPWGMQYIPVLEYLQMAGRAGRPGKEDFGEAILIAQSEAEFEKLTQVYIHGDVEDIYSKLAVEPVLRTYVLSLLATGVCQSRSELLSFFAKTFWAHQYGDMQHIQLIIQKVIDLLHSYKCITVTSTELTPQKKTMEFQSATDLVQTDSQPIHVTRLGQRISQLYIDPFSANHIIEGLERCQKTSTQITPFAILQLLSSTLELRPLLRVKAKEAKIYDAFLFEHEDELLQDLPTIYDEHYEDFTHSLKTTAYFLDWIDEKSEQELLKLYDIRPGEITAKNTLMDWLLYCSIELAHCLKLSKLYAPLQKIRKRLAYGVKEDVLALLQLKGIGRIRARKLLDKDISSIAQLKSIPFEDLCDILGKGLATDIKHQLGETISTQTTNTVLSTHSQKNSQSFLDEYR